MLLKICSIFLHLEVRTGYPCAVTTLLELKQGSAEVTGCIQDQRAELSQGIPLWLLMSSWGHISAGFSQHLYLHLHIWVELFRAMEVCIICLKLKSYRCTGYSGCLRNNSAPLLRKGCALSVWIFHWNFPMNLWGKNLSLVEDKKVQVCRVEVKDQDCQIVAGGSCEEGWLHGLALNLCA